MTLDDSELWQKRAEALLPILQAAISITHNPNLQLIAKNRAVLIRQSEFDALYNAVEACRLAAEGEQNEDWEVKRDFDRS